MKGKTGKGKSSGAGASTTFAGKCSYCGVTGHKKADCRKRIKDEASKPPGSVKAVEAGGSVEAITAYHADEEDDDEDREDFYCMACEFVPEVEDTSSGTVCGSHGLPRALDRGG